MNKVFCILAAALILTQHSAFASSVTQIGGKNTKSYACAYRISNREGKIRRVEAMVFIGDMINQPIQVKGGFLSAPFTLSTFPDWERMRDTESPLLMESTLDKKYSSDFFEEREGVAGLGFFDIVYDGITPAYPDFTMYGLLKTNKSLSADHKHLKTLQTLQSGTASHSISYDAVLMINPQKPAEAMLWLSNTVNSARMFCIVTQ